MDDGDKRVLEAVYDEMMIEPQWSIRSERSFTWWPHDFAQTISATPAVQSHGIRICRLTAATRIVEGIVTTPHVVEQVATLNGEDGGGLSALVLDDGGT